MNDNKTKSQELQGVFDMYRDDCPQLFPAEFRRWRIKYAEEEELPGSCATALKQCDEDEFPNIYTLLKLLSTLLVTSCECEGSFSAMRRLNIYMRYTMSENRLALLALMHIHYDMQIDLEEVVEQFATMHPRMGELSKMAVTLNVTVAPCCDTDC